MAGGAAEASTDPARGLRLRVERIRREGCAELPRRDFLRIAGAGTGALLAGAALTPDALDAQSQPPRGIRRRFGRASGHVAVVGAGAWGAFTAYHLRQQGMK
ncbi:MAG: hypothetical protein ACKORK_09435, partial [Gemmatimonadota bacterium]